MGIFLPAMDLMSPSEYLKSAVQRWLCVARWIKWSLRANAQFLADHIPLARLEIVPSAGHMVMQEQPQAVARLLQQFMGQLNY